MLIEPLDQSHVKARQTCFVGTFRGWFMSQRGGRRRGRGRWDGVNEKRNGELKKKIDTHTLMNKKWLDLDQVNQSSDEYRKVKLKVEETVLDTRSRRGHSLPDAVVVGGGAPVRDRIHFGHRAGILTPEVIEADS